MTDLRKLLAEATPGPWTYLIDSYEKGLVFVTADPTGEQYAIFEAIQPYDAALIVNLRNHAEDIATLIEGLARGRPMFQRGKCCDFPAGAHYNEDGRAEGGDVVQPPHEFVADPDSGIVAVPWMWLRDALAPFEAEK